MKQKKNKLDWQYCDWVTPNHPQYNSWMGKKCNLQMVKYAKNFLSKYPIKNTSHPTIPIDDFIYDGKEWELSNIMIVGSSKNVDGGLFLQYSPLIRLHHSYYALRFSMPMNSLKDFDTYDEFIPQTIRIPEWAYRDCVMTSINRILENHGKNLYNMMLHPKYIEKGNMYYKFINKIILKESIKKHEKNQNQNFNDDRKMDNKELVDEGESINPIQNNNENTRSDEKNMAKNNNAMIYYCDGYGNIYNGSKKRKYGHYSVYLKNTDEKWKKKEEQITLNQAEIKGVMACLYISMKRGYKHIIIYTDAKNVMKWINSRDTKIKNEMDAKWNTNDEDISDLIDKLAILAKKINSIEIKYINKDKNYARGI